VSWWELALVLVAGVGAGTINTVVGSGSLLTFPALLAVGLPPVTANVSNTVGMSPGNLSGAWGYRRELRGQGRRVLILGTASVAGAVVGAVLLLTLPGSAFDAIVPALIAAGVLLVIFGPRISRWQVARGRAATSALTPPLWALVLLTGVYGGYFGAAQGVILMAILALLLADDLQHLNGLKNALVFLVNTVAAVVFVATADVNWAAAATIAVGSVIGGLLGARIGRRLPPRVLRAVIVVVGVAAIVKVLT
jgi:uncharacterized membrane protein YfcA